MTTTNLNNIYSGIPDQLPEELFECILKWKGIEIERIISKGHITPIGEWYDQAWDEWILMLQGRAMLVYPNDAEPACLQPGEYLLIPAHCRHRVAWTDPDVETVWLAIHWRG